MRAIMIIVLLIAVGAAGVAAYLVNNYLASQTQQAQTEDAPLPIFTGQRVLVADEEIRAGEALRPSMFRWQPWPEEDILSSYKVIGDTEGATEQQVFNQRTAFEAAMSGKITRRFVAAGEPLTDQLVFDRDNASFMAGALRPGMRAIAIPVNETTGAAGFILPGDRVDILLTHDITSALPRGVEGPGPDAPVARYISETVLESLRVLAVDQVFREDEDDPRVVDTVTVEVTARQAEVINLAKRMGTMTLTLRALSDRQDPVGLASLLGFGGREQREERPLVSDRAISGGLDMMLRAAVEQRRANQINRTPPAPEPAPAPAPTRNLNPSPTPGPDWTVTVYSGTAEPTVYRDQGTARGQSRLSDMGDDGTLDDPGYPVGITPDMASEIPMEE